MASKHGLTVRVLATTGDVNLFEYGGGVVYAASQSHGSSKWIAWEFWEALSDTENADSIVDVYRVNVDDDLVERYGKDMVTKPSSFVDISKEDLLAGARSDKPIQRVLTLEAMIQYYGPYEFDQAPVKMTVRDLQKRWGRAVDGFRKRERQARPGRVRAEEPAASKGATAGAKAKPAASTAAHKSTKTPDRVHAVKTKDGVRIRVSGRGKEDYPVMHAAGTVSWRHPHHWSAETKKRAARALLELKAKQAAHVKIKASPAPKPAAKPKPPNKPKAAKAPKSKAPKAAKPAKPKAAKAAKPKAAKPKAHPKPKFRKGDHVAVPALLGVHGTVGTIEWSDTHKAYKYNVHFAGAQRQAQAGGANKWLLDGHMVKISKAEYDAKPKADKKPKAKKAAKPKAKKAAKPKAKKAAKPKAKKAAKPKAKKAAKPKAKKAAKPKAKKAAKPKAKKAAKPKAKKAKGKRVKPAKGAKISSSKPKAKAKR